MTPYTCIGSPMCVEPTSNQTPSNQYSSPMQDTSRPTQPENMQYVHHRIRQIQRSSDHTTHTTCRRLFGDEGDEEVNSLNLESLALNG